MNSSPVGTRSVRPRVLAEVTLKVSVLSRPRTASRGADIRRLVRTARIPRAGHDCGANPEKIEAMDACDVPTRRARKEDVAELVRLRHSMFRAMAAMGAGGRAEEVEDSRWYTAAMAAFEDRMARGVLAAFVVDDPAATIEAPAVSPPLVACAVATIGDRLPGPGYPRGTSGAMSSVYVEQNHRGRGFARAVVAGALAWLDECGAEVVDPHATAPAAPLYRSLGFAEPRSVALRRLLPTSAAE